MRNYCLAAAMACLFLPAPSRAQDAAPEIRQFNIATLEKLGHDMYVQDQAVWHATDTLMALHPKAKMMKEKVGGWIVESQPEATLVRFIRQSDNGTEAAYDIRYPAGADYTKMMKEKVGGWIVESQPEATLVRFIRQSDNGTEAAYDIRYPAGADYTHDKPEVTEPQDRHLSDAEKAQFSARTLALKSITQRCGDNYNTIVLKDPESDGWLAWALAATTNPNLVIAGGHHRLTVSADGTKVIQMDALSRSCAVMEKSPASNGGKVAALMTTQLVSNLPVETFVFLSLEHRIPIVVMTPDRSVWGVTDGKIAKMDLSRR